MINPEGSDSGNEWVSIGNFSPDDLDLEGWKLSDTKRTAASISGVILSGEARRVGDLVGVRLVNSSGQIALLDPNDCVVDRVMYSPRSHILKENVPITFHLDDQARITDPI